MSSSRARPAAGEPLTGAPFDLVYARLLLYHVLEKVLQRLWDAVAPDGHLLVQDYDVHSVSVIPPLDSVQEFRRVTLGAFEQAGCDIHTGRRLPLLFAQAGIGSSDGTDVAGRLEPLATAQRMFTGVYAGVLDTALQHGLTTPERSAAWSAAITAVADRHPDAALWPLLIGAWKRKPS